MNEDGQIIINKARLVCMRYTQIQIIDFEETFSPTTRLEALRMLLAFVCSKVFKLYQMDVKSTFLNGDVKQEVYMEEQEGFDLDENKEFVCRLEKAVSRLNKPPRALYARLDHYIKQ